MSRSYRNRKNQEIAYSRDRMNISKVCKIWKRWANKAVRKSPDLINGSMYQKVYWSWNIHDYRCKMKLPKDWHKQLGNSEYDYKYFMCK